MAKWKYFNPNHWNYLFPPLSHKDLRIIEEFIASHKEPADLIQKALQGKYQKTKFLEIHLYDERPTLDTLGISIRTAKQGSSSTTLKENLPLNGNTLGLIIKWVYKNNIETVFATDIRFLLKNSKEIQNGYQVYEHLLQDEEGKWHTYWGITKRTWKKRWNEHLSAANRGSDYIFHKTIRELLPKKLSMVHQVAAVGCSEEEAMNHEEWFVEHYTLFPDNPLGMNMIPGGYAGIRALHKLGITSVNHHVAAEDRDMIIEQYIKQHPRKGVSNPLISLKWENEDYATSVICGPEGRLSPDQIRDIRRLSSLGWDAESILTEVDARNLSQIERVLAGKTYSRIH